MGGSHHCAAADDDAGAEVIVPMKLYKIYRAYGHQIPDILSLIRYHSARNEHLKILILGAVEGAAPALHGQKLRDQDQVKASYKFPNLHSRQPG